MESALIISGSLLFYAVSSFFVQMSSIECKTRIEASKVTSRVRLPAVELHSLIHSLRIFHQNADKFGIVYW